MRFTVPGPPVPKARARTVRLRHGGTASFTPESTALYARKVQMCARTSAIRKTAGEVSVSISFYMATKRRSDVDNLAKAILDALNGIAWDDDDQVSMLFASKQLDRANPRAEVTIESVGGDKESA